MDFRLPPLYYGLNLPITFSGLAKVAIFTTNVHAENQTLINHKCVCEALNRHFCQARVSGSCFSFRPSHWFIVLIVCSYRNVVLFGLLKNTFHSRSLKGQTGIRLSLLLTDLVSRKPLYSE